MLKILVNSYTCCPGMGSEPGMGWNWIVSLAKYCEMYIVTEGEYREKIEEWLANLGNEVLAKNLHFYWNPIGDNDRDCERIRKMCWNQGDWRFYRFYKKWQKKTAKAAEDICKKEKIDILHQLNMIGFREPGYLWQVSKKTGIPFVWGPIDAKDSFPMTYAQKADFKIRTFLHIKNLITRFQLCFSWRVKDAANQANFIVGATSNSVKSIKKHLHLNAALINETGCRVDSNPYSKEMKKNEDFEILWVGKFDFRKQLDLALNAIASANIGKVKFHIIGSGNDESYKKMAFNLGISSCCVWHGLISHDSVQKIMRQCDLFLFTSIAEGTPHVVLESIANDLPLICFNTCGQGDCVTDDVGIKIPLTNPEQSIKDFANAIIRLYNNRDLLERMSSNCHKRAVELSWENKALQMLELYNNVVLSRDKCVSCSETGMTVGENDDIVGL